jgi:hypothetical protein
MYAYTIEQIAKFKLFEQTRLAKMPILPLCSTQTCQMRAKKTRQASIKLVTLLGSVNAPLASKSSVKLYIFYQILRRTSDCTTYHAKMDIFKGQGPSTQSSHHPLAFSHLMHKHAGILEMFLALTFRPTNSHCIHIAASTPDKTRYIRLTNINEYYLHFSEEF